MLEQEYKYWLDNEVTLLNLYRGKFIVIKDNDVIASYDDLPTAYTETVKVHKLGTFMIHECIPEDEQIQFIGPGIVFV